MAFAHRSGRYIFRGRVPFFVSKEIPIPWSGGSRAGAAQAIRLMTDDAVRENLPISPWWNQLIFCKTCGIAGFAIVSGF